MVIGGRAETAGRTLLRLWRCPVEKENCGTELKIATRNRGKMCVVDKGKARREVQTCLGRVYGVFDGGLSKYGRGTKREIIKLLIDPENGTVNTISQSKARSGQRVTLIGPRGHE